jgi:hypothetical protein
MYSLQCHVNDIGMTLFSLTLTAQVGVLFGIDETEYDSNIGGLHLMVSLVNCR